MSLHQNNAIKTGAVELKGKELEKYLKG